MKHLTHALLLASLLTVGLASVAHAQNYIPMEELSTVQLNPEMAGALATPGVMYTIGGNQFISKGSTCEKASMNPTELVCLNMSLYMGPSKEMTTSQGNTTVRAVYPVGIEYMLHTSNPKNLVTVINVKHVILPAAVATSLAVSAA